MALAVVGMVKNHCKGHLLTEMALLEAMRWSHLPKEVFLYPGTWKSLPSG